ncbi:MAG: PfkB family carbohydrate kinase [Anaerolineae bacterium]
MRYAKIQPMSHLDYLVIGHASKDLTPAGVQIGGTVSFSGQTAPVLGCRTAVLTSTGPDLDIAAALPHVTLQNIPAITSTTFENVYAAAGRTQTLHSRAQPITAAHIPADWQRASIVHLGPVANEVDPDIIHLFSNSLIGLTPQGWLRGWDADGRVHPQPWPQAEQILPHAAAVILSREDLADETVLEQFRQWSPLLVLTDGYRGCTVFLGDESRHILAPPVEEVEPTGAGDIFAAAFLIRLWQTAGNPWEAARFANEIAAQSVTQVGLAAKMEAIQRVASSG